MTSKFKVGDEVKTLNDSLHRSLGEGELAIVEELNYKCCDDKIRLHVRSKKTSVGGLFLPEELELVEPKQTKSQRIAELENRVGKLEEYDRSSDKHIESLENTVEQQGKEISELKLIVEQLRKPSTVEVVVDKQDVQRQTVECESQLPFDDVDYPLDYKTPNELRAEIIEKAKVFVDENGGDDYHFEVDEEKRTVFAWKIIRKGEGYDAQCHLAEYPKDKVFNEHIQRAIAFGRAEGLDVSEFEQAVQPIVAVGQIITFNENVKNRPNTIYKVNNLKDEWGNLTIIFDEEENLIDTSAGGGYLPEAEWYKILNDTNAIYGGVE